MLDVLLLRFDAPLVSFGGPIVDQLGKIQDFPGLSLLTGLLGNALGYDHCETVELNQLQDRLRFAARCDRRGDMLRDFQTVDLGQDHLVDTAWTTWGRTDPRGKGEATKKTHIRQRDYWADSVHTIALTLDPSGESPDLEAVERALREPERPLFIGRKCCLPAAPLLLGRTRAISLIEALRAAPRVEFWRAPALDVAAWWPEEPATPGNEGMPFPVTDERDWENQVHTGRRLMRQGRIRLREVVNGD